MKKSLLFALVLLLSSAVFAQTRQTIISEHFDGSTMPSGWSIMGSGAQNWSVSGTQNAGGTANEMLLTWSPQFNGTSRLCTNPVDLTGITTVVVNFKHCLDNYSGSHTLSIATSSDNGNTWNQGWTQNYGSSSVYEVTANVSTSDMGNNNVMFAICYTGNSYNINNWYFDNVEIFSQEQLDISLSSIDVDPVVVSGSNDVKFTVMNKGVDAITEIKVAYQVDENELIEEIFNTNLASLQSAQFTFAVPMTLVPGSYQLMLNIESVNGGDDDDLDNNTLEKSISAALGLTQRTPLIEHFSSSTCGPCVSVNNSMVTLENNNPGKYTYTKYAMSWPNPGDPYYTAEGGVRRTYYGVNAVPDCFLDATEHTPVSQAHLNAACDVPAFADVKGSFNVDGNTINVKVDFMAYYDISVEKAFVTVNEKETHGNVGSNGETTFHHIMMKFLTSTSGDAINIPAGDCQHVEYSYDMSSTHVEEMSDLEVSAWIQNVGTKEIINSHFLYEYTDIHPYPVQNLTFIEDEGEVLKATWEAPEGGNALSYNVYVNGELATNTTDLEYTYTSETGYQVISVEALYENDMTSVKMVTGLNFVTGVGENQATICNVYPNPTNGNIVVNGKNINEVQVYNVCGQQVVSVKANSENVSINLSSFAAGIYMVKVVDNQGNESVNKVVKR